MTRLITDWLTELESDMQTQEQVLLEKTGLSYLGLASRTLGFDEHELKQHAKTIVVAVVPVTAGQGVIGSFCETVAAIARTMEFQAFVTELTDVAGFLEAHQKGADVVFLADDSRFIATNMNNRVIADNDLCTAAGYVTALEAMAGELAGRSVLLLGYGTLGRDFSRILLEKGVSLTVYEKDSDRVKQLLDDQIPIIADPAEIRDYPLVIDATSEGDWLHGEMLHPELRMAAPGVPLSLDQETWQKYSGHVVHDVLPIGVAVMLAASI